MLLGVCEGIVWCVLVPTSLRGEDPSLSGTYSSLRRKPCLEPCSTSRRSPASYTDVESINNYSAPMTVIAIFFSDNQKSIFKTVPM